MSKNNIQLRKSAKKQNSGNSNKKFSGKINTGEAKSSKICEEKNNADIIEAKIKDTENIENNNMIENVVKKYFSKKLLRKKKLLPKKKLLSKKK